MPAIRVKTQLMSASEMDRTLVRLAHEVLEKSADLDKLAFIGIRRRGVPLAERLARKIESLENRKIPVGILDIKLYRDDLSTVGPAPVVSQTAIEFPITGKDIVLMDDVLYTGRTVRAALDALFAQVGVRAFEERLAAQSAAHPITVRGRITARLAVERVPSAEEATGADLAG